MNLTFYERNHRGDPRYKMGVNIPNWLWCAVKDEAKGKFGGKPCSEDIVIRNALKEHFARSKFLAIPAE